MTFAWEATTSSDSPIGFDTDSSMASAPNFSSLLARYTSSDDVWAEMLAMTTPPSLLAMLISLSHPSISMSLYRRIFWAPLSSHAILGLTSSMVSLTMLSVTTAPAPDASDSLSALPSLFHGPAATITGFFKSNPKKSVFIIRTSPQSCLYVRTIFLSLSLSEVLSASHFLLSCHFPLSGRTEVWLRTLPSCDTAPP